MKFFISKIIIFFLFVNYVHADNSIKFVDIDFIVNNSISGKNLNQLIDNKNKKITSELQKYGKKLEEKKRKIVSQKNILKKEEFNNLVKDYENEVKKFNEIRKKKTDEFNNFSINSKKKIIDLLNPLISSYLKKESIQILLQKDKIIFGDDNLDITKEIMKLFNDKHNKMKFE